MRNKTQLFVVALLLMVPFAMQVHAQSLQAVVAGSSAMWQEAGQGLADIAHGQPNCVWTTTKSIAFVTDSRLTTNNTEYGDLWIVWTPGTLGCANPDATSKVYAYISLDSTVGNRCLFAQPQCKVTVGASAGTAGAGKLKDLVTGETNLPAGILTAVDQQPVTIAATDVLPADAKFATDRALKACGPFAYYSLAGGGTAPASQFTGFGYGAAAGAKVGAQQIKSSVSGTFNIVEFSLTGADPFNTTLTVNQHYVTPVGAQPVLVIANKASGSGLANSNIKNVNHGLLADILTGRAIFAEDMIPQAGVSTGLNPMKVYVREFLSGTYLTMEHNIVASKAYQDSQEYGNCTVGTYNTGILNPMVMTKTVNGQTGSRNRVVGTGQMIDTVAGNVNGFGYAFWSKGNFSGKANLKYLTVDGVDPLFATYNSNLVAPGTIPGTTDDTSTGGALLQSVSLENVANGGYPIWSMLRLVSYSDHRTVAQDIAAAAQNAISPNQPDFIKASAMKVFRSHFGPVGISFPSNSGANTPSNGTCNSAAYPEAGGDVGGQVFTFQSDYDYCVSQGTSKTGRIGMRN